MLPKYDWFAIYSTVHTRSPLVARRMNIDDNSQLRYTLAFHLGKIYS